MENTQLKSTPVAPLPRKSGAGSFFWELIKVVMIAAMIIIPIRVFLFLPFTVWGSSMEPGFSDHDYLIVDEISYRLHEPARGDVIVFHFPRNPREFYIKRVIGLPNETVKIKGGEVSICNDQYPDCFILEERDYLSLHEKTPGNGEYETGPNNYFVLGDNRNASSDSRSWGNLSYDYVVGKVWLRAWPFSEMTRFATPAY